MTKLIWLSDLHFDASDTVYGFDTESRLLAAIDYVNERYSNAAACIISGDLVDRGTRADYKKLSLLLAALKVPVLPLAGNHDDRVLLREHLSLPATAMTNFIQYHVDLEQFALLCLDSQRTGSDAGTICNDRGGWLEEQLASLKDRSVIIFMHHPPMELGLPMQDETCLENGAAFLRLISKHGNVRLLCCGHVHRPASGVVANMPFATLRSAMYQAPAPVPEWSWADFKPAPEAPQLGVLELRDYGVTVQYHDFCRPEFGLIETSARQDGVSIGGSNLAQA
ncbi:MAG: metallophosphoesterase [Pseudomonadota bacterium]